MEIDAKPPPAAEVKQEVREVVICVFGAMNAIGFLQLLSPSQIAASAIWCQRECRASVFVVTWMRTQHSRSHTTLHVA